MVVSNTTLYNVEMASGPTKVAEAKWGAHLSCLSALSVEGDATLHLYFDVDKIKAMNKAAKSDKSKSSSAAAGATTFGMKEADSYAFEFCNSTARANFVNALRLIHGRVLGAAAAADPSAAAVRLPPLSPSPPSLFVLALARSFPARHGICM